jgi:hypothetical protein
MMPEIPKERRRGRIPIALERRSGKSRRTDRGEGAKRRAASPGMAHVAIGADFSGDQIEFMTAMDSYKRNNGRPFPTWSEVLEVFRSLGYRKVADPHRLPRKNAAAKKAQ